MAIFDHDSPDTAREILVHNYLHMFAISFLYYDHLITARQEVDYLWKRSKKRSSYWFFITRYFTFFGNIAVLILGFSNLPVQSCRRYNLFRQLLLIVNQVLVCILLTLRIYALYGCSRRILAYMTGSGMILAGISSVRLHLLPTPPDHDSPLEQWVLFGQKNAPSEKGSGCHVGMAKVTAIRLAGAWEALFVYDSIIFGLTLCKTWKARRDHAITGISIPLISLILRDGAIYFAVMALCNLSNILTFYLCGPFLRGSLSTFASSISVTMVMRLMLNLHETADEGILSTHPTDTNVDYASNYDTTGLDVTHSAHSDIDTIARRPRR